MCDIGDKITLQPAFPVSTQAMNLNQVPADGNEFLLRTRMEAAAAAQRVLKKRDEKKAVAAHHEMICEKHKEAPGNKFELSLKKSRHCQRETANDHKFKSKLAEPKPCKRKQSKKSHSSKDTITSLFLSMHDELLENKNALKEKFPSKVIIPLEDKNMCCLFCLGTRNYTRIYKKIAENPEDKHYPLLSLVIHLNDKEIMQMLEYFFDWSSVVGLTHDIMVWIYALLIILEKPIADENILGILESFYVNCSYKHSSCEDALVYPYEELIASLMKSLFDNKNR